jgi:hypothetical protein
LFGRFFLRHYAANLICAGRIDGRPALLDMLDDAVFIDDESSASGKASLFVKYAVVFRGFAFEIAEQREGDAYLRGKGFVGGEAVNADSQYLSVGCFKLGNISLICLQLLGSATCEGQHVEGQHHVLFAFEIAELHGLAVRIGEREIGSRVAYLQVRFRRRRRLRDRNRRQR